MRPGMHAILSSIPNISLSSAVCDLPSSHCSKRQIRSKCDVSAKNNNSRTHFCNFFNQNFFQLTRIARYWQSSSARICTVVARAITNAIAGRLLSRKINRNLTPRILLTCSIGQRCSP